MTQVSPDTEISQQFVTRAGLARRDGDASLARRCLMAAAIVSPSRPVGYVNLLGMTMVEGPEAGDPSVTRILLERTGALTPDDARVSRNLSVVATHAALPDLARRYLKRTLLIEPADPTGWRLLSEHACVPAVGRPAAALLNPDNPAVLRSGLAHAAANQDWDRALSMLALARDVDPSDDPMIADLQAEALLATNQIASAIGPATRLVRDQPKSARLWFRQGVLLHAAGNSERSRGALRRACLLAPDYGDAMASLSRAELQLKQTEAALRLIERALVLAPEPHGRLTKNRAAALVALRRGDEARSILRRALVVAPVDETASLNLASAEQYSLEFEAAERWIRHTLVLRPDHVDAQFNGGLLARYAGRSETALRRFDAAIERDPANAAYRYNRSGLQLQDGDRDLGLAEFHYRHQMEEFSSARRLFPETSLPQPLWDLSPAPGARVAIWGEQGIGDEIWFAQYLETIRDRVGSVVLEVSGKLVPTLKRSFPWIDVVARWAPDTETAMREADLQLPLGDLTALSAVEPPRPGYLRTNPDLVAAFRTRYARAFEGKRTIGLAWRSVKPAARMRSFEAPLAQWGPIFALADTAFVSLQYNPEPQDFRTVSERFGKKLFADPKVDTVDDIGALAAQVQALDAVVSVANSTVAVAHGVGRRAYVPLRGLQDDFRYPHRGTQSFWLPEVRFSWAPLPDRWEVALQELADRLERDGAAS